jgi:hypothetical protein
MYRIEDFVQIEVSPRMQGSSTGSERTARSMSSRFGLNLILKARDGSGYRLETYRAAQKNKVGVIARQIAEYCGLQLLDLSATR